MRLGVLDVGSNTVHLLVVDAHPGARPMPASSHKEELKLAEHLEPDGRIAAAGEVALITFIESCLQVAEDLGVEEMVAFATSALRDAPNGEEVLAHVRERTGVDLRVLHGGDESRLTFLAVRRWFGWSVGRLLVLDIGGGSLELGAGMDELPDVAISLPLGAGRLTRARLLGDPPSPDDVRAARRYVRAEVGRVVRDVVRQGSPDQVVGTSKTFRSLARVCGMVATEVDSGSGTLAAAATSATSGSGGAAAGGGGATHRVLKLDDLASWVPKLAEMTLAQRADLPGVSISRAAQLLAGALVAEASMELLGVEQLQICPWALREGVILRRLDLIAASNGG